MDFSLIIKLFKKKNHFVSILRLALIHFLSQEEEYSKYNIIVLW